MPHEDGSAYASVVATVSLGSSLVLDIIAKPEPEADGEQCRCPARIFQEPRSLLITTGHAYSDLIHGIAPIEVDEDLNVNTVANWRLLANTQALEEAEGKNIRGTRISLTYRDVLKVSSAANKVLGGFGRR